MKKLKAPIFLSLLLVGSMAGKLHAQNNSSLSKNKLSPDSTITQNGNDNIVLTEAELDDESSDNQQNISGLLDSGKDPFKAAATYGLSAYRFRQRGYDGQFESTYINGLEMNDAETGRFSYPILGGLNDITRNKETSIGFVPSSFSYGNLGETSNIDMRASQIGKGTKISLAGGNSSYNGRVMATYGTGETAKGWSFYLSGSRRISFDGYENVEGCFYNSWAVAMGLEKKFGLKHRLAFNAFFAPTKRGMQAAATEETFDLAGNNLYNPNWGYQNGEVRNARISNNQSPVAILQHEWKANTRFKLATSLGFKYANSSTTALNWYNSSDPRPDYYRYLPSYYEDTPETAALLTESWKNDETTRQINWDNLYQINYLANMTNLSARYIVEERHNDQLALTLNSTANWKEGKHLSIDAGIQASSTKGIHYKVLNDLLGANYWLDVDQFAEREDNNGNTDFLQNDLNNPNRQIKVGDTFGYNYNMYVHKANVWLMSNWTFNHIEAYVGGKLTGTEFYREGLMKNGRAPENSYGVGEKHDFLDYSTKAGLTYKLSGRHIFTANVLYQTEAPLVANSYYSPRTKDTSYDGLKSETDFSYDFNYFLRLKRFSARLSAFRTEFKDQAEISSAYNDVCKSYLNMLLYGINKTHQGLEFGFDAKLMRMISLYGAASVGQYMYTNRPTLIASYENGYRNDTIQTDYIKNFFVNGTPQVAGSLGVKLNLPKYWWVDIRSNYGTRSYTDLQAIRRSTLSLKYNTSEEAITKLSKQEMLKGGYTFDLSVGKSVKLWDMLALNFNLMVNNILDNREIQNLGYEQSRLNTETNETSAFDSKFSYAYGRNFMFIIGLRF